MTRPIFFCLLLMLSLKAAAQNTRLNEHNHIAWLTNTTTLQFGKKWSGHLEYQWRRVDGLRNWQQSVLRTGINYDLTDRLQLRVGYAWIETFPYSETPLQAAGKQFPEHRTYQMATLTDRLGRLGLSHRFMLEQRWVGRYSIPALDKPDDHVFTNRFRYMLRLQLPLNRPAMADKTLYAAAYDEILLSFGQNVGENVYDQNRLGVLLGYRFNKTFRAEAGFLQQLLQLGREVGNRNVFQYNNGVLVNTYLTLGRR